MASIISAGTTSGTALNMAGDTSGVLELATNGSTTAITIDTSQRAAFVAGTAALPAITTTGDTNTGMFFPAADTIAFAEGGAEAMRINSSGNLGIGTSSPLDKLSVSGGITATGQFIPYNGATALGYIGNDNSISGGTGTNLGIRSETAINFATGGATERMRIDPSGNLLIARTTILSAGKISIDFDQGANQAISMRNTNAGNGANYILFLNSSSNQAGLITQTGATTVAYTTTSDYRMKENILPMVGALDKVAQLKPVTYKWKADGSDGQGFIAHELQEVISDCVTGEKDAVETYTDENGIEQTRIKPQGIDTSFLVATLTAAIQEQQTIINDLTARITALEGAA
jgi:hypothetical protein